MVQDLEEAMPGGSAVSGIRDPDEECSAWVAEGLCILKPTGNHGRVGHSAFFSLLIFL